MAFGDNVMLKFYSSEPRDTGPAYEEVGDIDDLDDEVFSMIDQMTKSTESVDSGLGDETDTDDNPDEYDGGDDDVYADDEFDDDDDDECDDEFDDCDDDDLEFDEECTESGIADLSPQERFPTFKKMVMNNSKWSPEKKKQIIANYIAKYHITDADASANEALSDIGCLDDEILDDSPLNKIINMSYDFYDDSLYPEHAEYASNLKSGSHDLDDELEALLDDVLGFDGDSTAKHSASLKSGTKRYAGESAIDAALETLLNRSNMDPIDEALESLLGANESYIGSKVETDIVAKVKRMVKDYKAMPAGSAKKGYGTRIAKLITPKRIVRTLEKYGEWDKIPSELKGGHRARVTNQAVKDGIKYDKRKAKETSKKLKSGLEGLSSYKNPDSGVWYSTGGLIYGKEANKHLRALQEIQSKGLSEEKQVQAIVAYERKHAVSFTRRELQAAGIAGAVIGAVLTLPLGGFGAYIGADIGNKMEHNKELERINQD